MKSLLAILFLAFASCTPVPADETKAQEFTAVTTKSDGSVSTNIVSVGYQYSFCFAVVETDTNGLPTRLDSVNGVDMRRFLTLAKEFSFHAPEPHAILDGSWHVVSFKANTNSIARWKEYQGMLAKIEEAVK